MRAVATITVATFLARWADLPTGLYILPSVFFLNREQLSQDLPGRFSQSFHRIKSVFDEIDGSEPLFSIFKGMLS